MWTLWIITIVFGTVNLISAIKDKNFPAICGWISAVAASGYILVDGFQKK